MTYTVYKHVSPDGKVYIGITSGRPETRWKRNGNGYKNNKHLYSAIQLYGWDAFDHVVIAEGLTKEEACDMEQSLISSYNSTDPNHGYNFTIGGNVGSLGYRHSDEAKIRISQSARNISDETRRKKSESHKGRVVSEETRRKLSESKMGTKNPQFGKHPSEETRRKLSEASKNRSEETRRKVSEALSGENHPMYGKHHSAESRAKMSKAHANRVLCVETGIVYDSLSDAGNSVGKTFGAIAHACRGRCKTAGGFHWRYIDDDSSE